jgi:hypothetical protein
MFVIGKQFQSSLLFVGKARSLSQSGASEGSSIGQAPFLPTNIRLSWKGLPGTNTLAYNEHS